jgi:glycosyltransferase involved in cell wall biosynthesis
VGPTIARLLDSFTRMGYKLELIAVDNGSSDRTGEIIRNWSARNAGVVPWRVEVNQGYGYGVLSAIRRATAPWVGVVPADGQVDAEDVVRLYETAAASTRRVLAKARRRFRMDGPIRKIVSVSYNMFFRMLWPGVASIDINGLPKIIPREYLLAMNLRSKDWFLDPEIMIKAHELGLPILEFNVFGRMRSAGLSHVRPSACAEFFRNLLRYRFRPEWKADLQPVVEPARADWGAAREMRAS